MAKKEIVSSRVVRAESRPAVVPDPAPAASEPAETVARIAITLKPDGSAIDWERMRDSTKTKLIEIVKGDPKLQPSPVVGAPTIEVFTEQWCGIIYDALGQLEAMLVARIYKVSPEHAAVMCYTDADKRMLTGPTQKVLNKYAGAWLTQYSDEAVLLIAIGSIHANKLQQLRAAVEASRPSAIVLPMRKDEEGA